MIAEPFKDTSSIRYAVTHTHLNDRDCGNVNVAKSLSDGQHYWTGFLRGPAGNFPEEGWSETWTI